MEKKKNFTRKVIFFEEKYASYQNFAYFCTENVDLLVRDLLFLCPFYVFKPLINRLL